MFLMNVIGWLLPFFPLVILLDYNKKKHGKMVITYIISFYTIGGVIVLSLKTIGLNTIPVVISIIVIICLVRWTRFRAKE